MAQCTPANGASRKARPRRREDTASQPSVLRPSLAFSRPSQCWFLRLQQKELSLNTHTHTHTLRHTTRSVFVLPKGTACEALLITGEPQFYRSIVRGRKSKSNSEKPYGEGFVSRPKTLKPCEYDTNINPNTRILFSWRRFLINKAPLTRKIPDLTLHTKGCNIGRVMAEAERVLDWVKCCIPQILDLLIS